MRILHGPQNISGMAYSLAVAQRQFGVDAEAVTQWSPVYNYASDRWLDATGEAPHPVDPDEFRKAEYLSYDVYHFYFGLGYGSPDLSEFRKLKAKNKKIYMYYCGCDLRDSKQVLQTYEFSVCQDCWPQACSPNRADSMKACRQYADGVFVSTVDLLDEWPEAIWLPQPVNFAYLQQVVEDEPVKALPKRFTKRRALRIAHAPSDPMKKGTRYLERAVAALTAEGLNIELVIVSGEAHENALRKCAGADIVVDQLMAGVYGSFAVEMMAIGKPVIAFMRDSWLGRFPEPPPIISATPDSIAEVIRDVYRGKHDLAAHSSEGRAFVLKFHDSVEVARKALEAYGHDVSGD
jgi:hypothetical protein